MKIIFLAGKNTEKQTYKKLHHPWLPVVGTYRFFTTQAINQGKTVAEVYDDALPMAKMIFWQDFNRLVKKRLSFVVDLLNLTVRDRRNIINLIPDDYEMEIVYWANEWAPYDPITEIPTMSEGFTKVKKGELNGK